LELGQAVKIKQAKGFSLIELIIVIAILGIVSAIAAPNFNKYRQNTNLKEAARDLASDISYWRQRTVAENIRYRIVLNKSENSYSIQKATSASPGPEDYADLVPPVTKYLSAISNQVIISDIAFSGTPPRIYIQSRGTIIPFGSVTLQHKQSLLTKIITANAMGRVKVE